MSGYQYYEFAAIDRPLTEKEMEGLRNLREVAARRGRIDDAQQRIEQYRERFARRHSLMRRFRDAGL